MSDEPQKLKFKPVTKASWPDFETLVESPGAPSYCWCMAWRANAEEVKAAPRGSDRKPLMEGRVKSGTIVGLVGYLDGEPVASKRVGRRAEDRDLVGGSRGSGAGGSVAVAAVREHADNA